MQLCEKKTKIMIHFAPVFYVNGLCCTKRWHLKIKSCKPIPRELQRREVLCLSTFFWFSCSMIVFLGVHITIIFSSPTCILPRYHEFARRTMFQARLLSSWASCARHCCAKWESPSLEFNVESCWSSKIACPALVPMVTNGHQWCSKAAALGHRRIPASDGCSYNPLPTIQSSRLCAGFLRGCGKKCCLEAFKRDRKHRFERTWFISEFAHGGSECRIRLWLFVKLGAFGVQFSVCWLAMTKYVAVFDLWIFEVHRTFERGASLSYAFLYRIIKQHLRLGALVDTALLLGNCRNPLPQFSFLVGCAKCSPCFPRLEDKVKGILIPLVSNRQARAWHRLDISLTSACLSSHCSLYCRSQAEGASTVDQGLFLCRFHSVCWFRKPYLARQIGFVCRRRQHRPWMTWRFTSQVNMHLGYR